MFFLQIAIFHIFNPPYLQCNHFLYKRTVFQSFIPAEIIHENILRQLIPYSHDKGTDVSRGCMLFTHLNNSIPGIKSMFR